MDRLYCAECYLNMEMKDMHTIEVYKSITFMLVCSTITTGVSKCTNSTK